MKISVISGVGTRNYYRKLGYELDGPYMSKSLHWCLQLSEINLTYSPFFLLSNLTLRFQRPFLPEMSKTFLDKDLDAEMAEMEEDGSEEEEDMEGQEEKDEEDEESSEEEEEDDPAVKEQVPVLWSADWKRQCTAAVDTFPASKGESRGGRSPIIVK